MAKFVLILMISGSAYKGPAVTIDGFSSRLQCERAALEWALERRKQQWPAYWWCVERG